MSGAREIIFDTETTGFDAKGEDRITEIGCLEVIDLIPTGRTYHSYLDPQRDVPEKVTEITGLTREFLTGKPLFSTIADDFLAFVGDSKMVAHNADFDRGFINAELERAGYDPIEKPRFIDTLKIAREKFPGSPASLDALCKRFNISLKGRTQHGALIDAELLAEVYLDLRGGRARRLRLDEPGLIEEKTAVSYFAPARKPVLPLASTEAERESHRIFIEKLGEKSGNSVWQYYWEKSSRRGS